MENVTIDPRLQERYHRDLAGKTRDEIKQEIPFDGRFSWQLYFEGTQRSALNTQDLPNDETLEDIEKRVTSLLEETKGKSAVLFLGSSIINHYILEYLQCGTIGQNKPTDPTTTEELDFQKNDELRKVDVDESMKLVRYSSTNIS